MTPEEAIVALRKAERNIVDQISILIRAAERQAAESMRERCATEVEKIASLSLSIVPADRVAAAIRAASVSCLQLQHDARRVRS